MNTTTPRVFIAATQQNDGKTTVSVGLFAALHRRLGRIGFIKPVGQRFVNLEGKQVDEDSVLIEETFHPEVPLEHMSPIAVEPDFTRRYIDKANSDFLVKRIQNSFDRAAWEKEFTIIEGTGHAGVGSVFDLSNARVARLLQSKVLLVTKGGIGRPIDEIALNKALFDREGVEIVGVILNKVLPEKMETVQDFARRGLARLGIDLLGVIPSDPLLASPSLEQIAERIQGRFLHGGDQIRRRIDKVIIGAMSSRHVMEHFGPHTLLITPGDRDDVLLAALATSGPNDPHHNQIEAIVLSGGLEPPPSVMDLLQRNKMPVILAEADSYTVASRIHSMTIKTLPSDKEKIGAIPELIEKNVEIDRLLEKL